MHNMAGPLVKLVAHDQIEFHLKKYIDEVGEDNLKSYCDILLQENHKNITKKITHKSKCIEVGQLNDTVYKKINGTDILIN